MKVQTAAEIGANTTWTEIQFAFQRSAKQRLGAAWCKSESNLAWGQPTAIACQMEQLNDRMADGKSLADFDTSVETMIEMGRALADETDGTHLALDKVLGGLCLAYHLNRFGTDHSCANIVESLLSHFGFEPSSSPSIESGSRLLVSQLVSIEFPLVVLAQCFTEVSQTEFQTFATKTARRFEWLLDATVDGDGWVESQYFPFFWQLAASWARTFAILQQLEIPIGEETRQQLEWVSRQFIRSMGPDGRQMLGPEQQQIASLKFIESIVGLSIDRVDKKLARLRDPNQESKKKDDINLTLVDEGGFSEWASSGILQCGWGSSSPRIAISADRTELNLEIAAQVSLIRGRSEPQVRFNDQLLKFFHDEHEIRCWHCDDGVEYVEFEFQLDQGVKLERQILLCREDHFAIMADAVCFPESGKIDYELRLPLSDGISVMCESETREVYLKDDQIRSLVLPLGLGEWKADGMQGSLLSEDGRLVLKQSFSGRAIYAPLFIDLSPRRSKRPRTWRHLTVAEERTNLKRDEAVAFRIQIGKEQWLVYRSLNGTGNRTFMGENQICEYFVARTDGDTEADELLQIE